MAKEKEASIYKRKILDFKEFSKGKDSVQEPKKHVIKEGESKAPTSREEMLKLLHQKFPNVIAKSEPFQKDDKRGIWSGAENSSFIDDAKKISAFNPTDSYSYNPRLDKDYEEEVHKTLHKFLKEHGWYTEFYDAGTPIFYPVWGANEALINEKELTQDAKDFIAKKIKKLIGEGRPQKQAVAMAYSYAKKEGYDVPNESLQESAVTLPYKEEDRGRFEKQQDRNGYWDYSPEYAPKTEVETLTGKQRNFTQDEWDAFYKARYEDVNSRDDDEKGINTSYINVSLGNNEGEVIAYEKGFAVFIGKHTGQSNATDYNNLRKMPVFISTIEEVIPYLKQNNKGY